MKGLKQKGKQRISNQTPYKIQFADHMGGTANQHRCKAVSPDTFIYLDQVQEIRIA